MLYAVDALLALPLGSVVTSNEVSALSTIRGSAPYGRFGSSMAVSSSSSSLYAGAPYQDTNTFSFDGRELGAVYAFDTTALAGTNATTSAACWTSVGARPRARFGSSLTVVGGGGGGGVMVGSPLAAVNGQERVGGVDVFLLPLHVQVEHRKKEEEANKREKV